MMLQTDVAHDPDPSRLALRTLKYQVPLGIVALP